MEIPSRKRSRGQHEFTHSPGRSQGIFGSVGRGGLALRLAAEPDFDEPSFGPTREEISQFAQQESELLIDSNVTTAASITERSKLLSSHNSYGAAETNSDSKDGDSDSLGQVNTISSAWEQAIHNSEVQTTARREVFYLAKSSVPLTLTFLLQYSLNVASVFSVGHLGKTELGAVSIATMTANITGFAMIQGLATCLDTLCAQAYGAGNFHQVGEHFQKGMLMIMAFFIPVGVFWIYSAPVLNFIVEDQKLVGLAVQYLEVVMLSIPAYIAFECGKRFLQAQGIFHATTAVLVVCAPVNAILNYVLVWSPAIGLGFIGAPLAVAISSWLMAIMLLLFVVFVEGKKCWGGVSMKIFQNWGDMISLAIPGVVMIEAEFLAFEILTLASSRFGTTALAAQSVITTVLSALYQVPFAVGIGASTRVANFVGASLTESAKISTLVSILISGLIGVIDCSVCYYFRFQIGSAFSNDEDVIELVAKLVPIIMCCHFFDAPGAILAGLLRGIGRQSVGGYLNLAVYYILGVPLSLAFAFVWGYELLGLWIGIFVALIIIAIGELLYLYYCNWDKIIEEAEKRKQLSDEESLA